MQSSEIQRPVTPNPAEQTQQIAHRRAISALMTHERWAEVARIALAGLIALLFQQGMVALPVLWGAVAIGLYPLVRTGARILIDEHRVGTEVFVTMRPWSRSPAAKRSPAP